MSVRLRIVAGLAGALAATTALGACTSSAGGSRAAAPAVGAASSAATAGGGASLQPRVATGGTGRASADVVLDVGTAKIRIAYMTVQVRRGATVSTQADRAEAIAVGAGGDVDADERSSGRYAEATVVLRVPPEQLSGTLDQLSRLGIERSRHLSTQDVTSKVADVTSRVTSAREAIARLRLLYQRAVKIADVINIESELSQRESDLEALEAQQRALTAQTATASITLTLTAPATPAPKPAAKHHDTGFVGGLRDGWHAFTAGLRVLATVIGAALPFAVLAALLLVGARLLWTRLRPSRAARETP